MSQDIGRIAYEAFAFSLGGAKIPWEHLDKKTTDAWRNAGAEIIRQHKSQEERNKSSDIGDEEYKAYLLGIPYLGSR